MTKMGERIQDSDPDEAGDRVAGSAGAPVRRMAPSVSIHTLAPQDNALWGEYTTLLGPRISTSSA